MFQSLLLLLVEESNSTTPYSQVEGEAQGTEDALKEFVSHLNKGPSAASVTGVGHDNIDAKDGEIGFVVR